MEGGEEKEWVMWSNRLFKAGWKAPKREAGRLGVMTSPGKLKLLTWEKS